MRKLEVEESQADKLECTQQERKTIAQDSSVSWKTLRRNLKLPTGDPLHMTVCYMTENSYIEIFQPKLESEEEQYWGEISSKDFNTLARLLNNVISLYQYLVYVCDTIVHKPVDT